MRDPDSFVDAHYTDRYGHNIVPGSWVHLILPGSDALSVCQALHYERWGDAWVCVIASPYGEEIGLFGRQCAQSVVRLGEPIHPDSSEWVAVERALRSREKPPPATPLAAPAIALRA